MLGDFHVTHRHPDLRMPKVLLQNGDIGPGQNGAGSKYVTQVVEVHGPAQSQVVADAIMGFADASKLRTLFPRTRKNPVVVGPFLPALLQEFKHLLTHRQRAFGVFGFPTHVPYWLTIAALTCSNGCWHAWASFKSREYSPGVVTGFAIYIPFAIYGYNHFLRSGAVSMTTALIAAIIGASYHFWFALFHIGPQR
jgi:Protein of unknown function with HXXEE motif